MLHLDPWSGERFPEGFESSLLLGVDIE